MKDMSLRRSQLVTTFGAGSLVVSPEGDTAIIGALDKWFYNKDSHRITALGEYEIQEPRLKALLKVKYLLLPPDFRSSHQYKGGINGIEQTNTDIYIPMLRFPTWHYCPHCKTLHQHPLSARTSWMECKECSKKRKMIQVPFVIVCAHGHISDFPWREWVHQDEHTTCSNQMKLVSTGGATLDSLKVKCGCNKERSLRGITSRTLTDGDDNGISMLSQMLNKDKEKLYRCPGSKPWYGSEKDIEVCNDYPVAVLKNSANIYFPNTISAIHLPGTNTEVEELIDMFEKYGVSNVWLETYDKIEGKIKFIKQTCPPEINDYKLSDIELAILYIENGDVRDDGIETAETQRIERELRIKEFDTLVNEIDYKSLKVINDWNCETAENNAFTACFDKINRVTKLKETIVLTGFNRLSTDEKSGGLSELKRGRSMLFKDLNSPENNWLPAYKVYGEGIFFTLKKEKLDEWEKNPDLKYYFQRYLSRYEKHMKNLNEVEISPRYVLLHTLSHIIIDELALTCGYNSASLRERLYLEANQCGVLIYTSSGDSDGTFGGLVRMGKNKIFFPVIQNALEKARWCSSDPVCSEIGMSYGQGINFLNGAACHSCAHLPETSCELRNLVLDRTLLIHEKFGFFNI